MKLKAFLIIIFSCIIRQATSQDIQKTFEFANDLYAKKEYLGAVEAFKRVLFFDEKNEFGSKIYPKIANSLYEIERYDEAAGYYDLAYFLTPNDSLKTEIILRKTSCFLLIKNYQYAQIELLNLPENLPESLKKKQEFYLGILHFALNDFSESKEHFMAMTDTNATEKQQKIEVLFKKNDRISRLNPKKAKILSMIIPGAGQIYAGDIKNGLNSFVLEGGLLLWAYYASFTSTALDAIVTVLPWYQRYYTGGFNRAETIAKNQIKKRRNWVFNELLDVVEK